MDSLPEDMESRRLADLEKFAQNHPDHPMVPLLMKQVRKEDLGEREAEVDVGQSKNNFLDHWLRECQHLKFGSRGKRQCAVNKWDKESSLELLGAVKKFEDILAELSIRGIRVQSDSRWATITQNIPNRHGLEPPRFTRSCKVHFASLCRLYKGINAKAEDLDPQVREAMEAIFQVAGETAPPVPRRAGFEANGTGDRGENVNIPNTPTPEKEKLERADKQVAADAAARKTAVEKPTRAGPDQMPNGASPPQVMRKSERREALEVLFSRINENTKGGDHGGVAGGEVGENGDPREQGPSHPHRQEQRENPPTTTDCNATLKRWDTERTLQLLAALERVGPKAEARWEKIASQLPNPGKLSPLEHVRSCKEQYRDVISVYKRETCGENPLPGHKPLADEVYSQVEKWVQLCITWKAQNPKNTEIPRAEKWGAAPEKVAVNPAFKLGEERIAITKHPALTVEEKLAPVAEDHGKMGAAMQASYGLPDREGLDDSSTPNVTSRDDTMPSESDSDNDTVWEYRKTKKRAIEEDEEQSTRICPTGKKRKLQRADSNGGVMYADNLGGSCGKQRGRTVLRSAPLHYQNMRNQEIRSPGMSRTGGFSGNS